MDRKDKVCWSQINPRYYNFSFYADIPYSTKSHSFIYFGNPTLDNNENYKIKEPDIVFKSRLTKKEYLFRRTFLRISDETLVELVALLTEPNQFTYTELHESIDTVAVFSREMHIAALPRRKAKHILSKEYLIEQHPLNHYQFNYLVSNYKDNLLDVPNELLNRIKKGR